MRDLEGFLRDEYPKRYTKIVRQRVDKAAVETGKELKELIQDNFSEADAMFREHQAGLTGRAEFFWNPAELMKGGSRPGGHRVSISHPDSNGFEVRYFDSVWLDDPATQRYRDPIVLRIGRSMITIRGRGTLGPKDNPYFYWRFLEYGTVTPPQHVMVRVNNKGTDYYFMASINTRRGQWLSSLGDVVPVQPFPAKHPVGRVINDKERIHNIYLGNMRRFGGLSG
ncbi:MAG: hypothetical protein WC476_01150 [Phycisphaerae bacterium]|jgi:hypothetical protein